MPGKHALHLPGTWPYLPKSQFWQVVAAPLVKLSFEVYKPCLHSVQTTAAGLSLIQPTGQIEHIPLPFVATYLPAAHVWQAVDPLETAFFPILHCWQDVGGSNSSRFQPCGHSKHTLLPFVATYFPAAHIWQRADPSEAIFPLSQSRQIVWVVKFWNCPAIQFLQPVVSPALPGVHGRLRAREKESKRKNC